MKIEDWGCIDYVEAVERQLLRVEQVAQGDEETLVFCSHPSVVTMGKGASLGDLTGWQGKVVEVSRGGRATYHGPGQIVIYPIINLQKNHVGFRSRDVHAYLRALEQAIIEALKEFGIEGRSMSKQMQGKKHDRVSYTGVWVGERKLASIGVAVKKWVTYHGAAINIEEDRLAFQGISPCGFQTKTMVNLQELNQNVQRGIVQKTLQKTLCYAFAVE